MDILTSITILVLAAFVGFEVISKVPNTLHTPLMSGTNAIHGIVLLGGLLILSSATGALNKLPQQVFKVKIVSTQSTRSKLISTRTYNGCIKSKPKTTAFHIHPHHHSP